MADGAEYVGFDDLSAWSDVLSLNLPLNISSKELSNLPNVTS